MDNILIVRLSSLGDIIHTLPAYAALRRHFPGARIRWAVEQSGREILDLVPGIDGIIVVGRKIWRQNIRDLGGREQTALDFQGLVKSALLALLSRSRRIVGFSKENCREPLAAAFYKEKLPPFSEADLHVISKNLRLLSLVGIREERYEFPVAIPEELQQSVVGKLAPLGYDKDRKLLLLNVGAAWETKRWFAERWVELLGEVKFGGAFPLILWGNRVEKALALSVGERTRTAVAPYLSVQEVLALLRMTSVLVSGDTFVLQAACAFNVPVVGLFGPTSPRRNGPFAVGDRTVSSPVSCGPCYKRTCPTLECLKGIGVPEVAAAVRALWDKAAGE
jgi:lipopolysaccharide heptosyltransferase I